MSANKYFLLNRLRYGRICVCVYSFKSQRHEYPLSFCNVSHLSCRVVNFLMLHVFYSAFCSYSHSSQYFNYVCNATKPKMKPDAPFHIFAVSILNRCPYWNNETCGEHDSDIELWDNHRALKVQFIAGVNGMVSISVCQRTKAWEQFVEISIWSLRYRNEPNH